MPIPDDHNVARYCGPGTIDDGRVRASAFLRGRGHPTLSVNDVNMAPGLTEAERLSATKQMMLITLKPTGMLAVLPVRAIRLIEAAPKLDVIHDPVSSLDGRRNEAHCGVTNGPTEDADSLTNSVALALRDAVIAEVLVRDL